jgi:hypothetical protein
LEPAAAEHRFRYLQQLQNFAARYLFNAARDFEGPTTDKGWKRVKEKRSIDKNINHRHFNVMMAFFTPEDLTIVDGHGM